MAKEGREVLKSYSVYCQDFHQSRKLFLAQITNASIPYYGDMDIPNIIEDINAYGLHPLDVKKMTIKSPRYKGQSNYLVLFDAEDGITLPLANQAKYICNTAVRWAYYKEAQNRIQQCNNCYRFGHNNTGCKLKVVCFLCANHHKAENCPLTEKKRASGSKIIPQNLLKCTNCSMKEGIDDQHTAIFQNCPSRILYKSKTRNNGNMNRNTRQAYSPAPLPRTPAWNNNKNTTSSISPTLTPKINKRVLIQPHLPSDTSGQISRPTASMTQPWTSNTPNGEPHNKLNQVSNKSRNNTKFKILESNTPKHSKSASYRQTISNSSIDSFTTQEMTEIFREMVSSISNCSNKEEQLSALLQIALKYTPCRD